MTTQAPRWFTLHPKPHPFLYKMRATQIFRNDFWGHPKRTHLAPCNRDWCSYPLHQFRSWEPWCMPPLSSQNLSKIIHSCYLLPKDGVDPVLPNSASHAWAPQVIRSRDKGRKEGRKICACKWDNWWRRFKKQKAKKLCSGPKGQTMSHQTCHESRRALPTSYYTKLSY